MGAASSNLLRGGGGGFLSVTGSGVWIRGYICLSIRGAKPKALNLGYCPHPVTVHIKGPIKGYIEPYHNFIAIIRLLLRGGSIQPKPFKCSGFGS